MTEWVHMVRLEVPADALRTACGTLRIDKRWTARREQVTCTRCLHVINEQQVHTLSQSSAKPGRDT